MNKQNDGLSMAGTYQIKEFDEKKREKLIHKSLFLKIFYTTYLPTYYKLHGK